ncbi:hypothetical protein [Pelovirga terrestris]|uniref:Uncharacterized protein n=1 Tax=Pelovirga terrestris TaxID=2771352 RepID=A0A8J6QW85_9BACT|nr:hypothetical protein [Pelovirga terrestris]MBD1399438.1 hypothetical protein [Pelovirga terrestris]
MSSYKIDSTNQTVAFLTSGVIAALLFNQPIVPVESRQEIDLLQKAYISSAPSPTHDQYRSSITHEFMFYEDPFVTTMSAVYEKLLIEQEDLGLEFQTVLNENLWELYES